MNELRRTLPLDRAALPAPQCEVHLLLNPRVCRLQRLPRATLQEARCARGRFVQVPGTSEAVDDGTERERRIDRMRWFIGTSSFFSLLGAIICLARLGMPNGWPVTLKYERWEYAAKVVFGIAWAVWGLSLLFPR
jgi:hypothetical protein